MATIDWPGTQAFYPRDFQLAPRVPKSGWSGFFTGQTQSISHSADRLICTLELRPCSPDEAGEREAFVAELVSAGHWVRLWHMVRPIPLGTLRGSPTMGAAAAAGVRSITVQTTPGATLRGGDMLGSGSQLLPVAYAGAVANGSGVMTVPLQVPTRVALSSGAAVTWQQPTGTFQLMADNVPVGYGRGKWQRAIGLSFREVF